MLTHDNVISFLDPLLSLFPESLKEDALSYCFLPLCHAAEKNAGFYARISGGLTTVFASSIANLLDEIQWVKPTAFGSVPRIFEVKG